METIIRNLKHKINHTKDMLSQMPKGEERKKLTVHGYYSIGYHEGKLAAYEAALDAIEEAGSGRVTVVVFGGVVQGVVAPDGIEVEVIDLDNEPEREEEAREILGGGKA